MIPMLAALQGRRYKPRTISIPSIKD